jgi:PKD repeat protein/DNA-binding MarR family transcriptional regulator
MRHRRARGGRPRALTALGLVLLFGALAPLLPAPTATAHPASAPPGGLILSARPTQGFAPLLVAFNVTPPNRTLPALAWAFGDGGYLNGTGRSFLTPTHVYVVPGNYLARVTATWGNASLNASLPIRVLGSNLSVAIQAAPASGSAPLTVNFTGLPTGGTGTYVAYLWNLTNGTVGSGPVIRYTFVAPGAYTVTLSVTDSRNHTASAATTIDVAPPGSPARPGNGGSPLSLTTPVVLFLLAAGGGAFVVSLLWAFSLRRSRRGSPSDPAPSDPGPGPTTPGPTTLGSPPATPVPSAELHEPTGGAPVTAVAASALPTVGPTIGIEPPASPPRPVVGIPAELPGADTFQGRRQLTQQLIRHLSSLPRLGPSDIPTAGFTQAGIAEALEVRRGAVSKVLQRLVAAGFIEVRTEHVTGGDRRVRVYRLTARGEQLALALRGERAPPRGGAPALAPIRVPPPPMR